MLNFKDFFENDGSHVAYLPSDFTGSEAPPTFDGRPGFLSSIDAVLPNTTKTAKIQLIEKNKNPIVILLSDGTKLYLTWDEFKRIPGPVPTVGKSLTVVFQRLPNDNSKEPSQINSILCH